MCGCERESEIKAGLVGATRESVPPHIRCASPRVATLLPQIVQQWCSCVPRSYGEWLLQEVRGNSCPLTCELAEVGAGLQHPRLSQGRGSTSTSEVGCHTPVTWVCQRRAPAVDMHTHSHTHTWMPFNSGSHKGAAMAWSVTNDLTNRLR